MGLDVRILGPLEISHGIRPVVVRGAKERALLVRLALDAGRVVSSERLVTCLWDSEPPASAETSLRVLVSRVRKALAEAGATDVLLTRAPGYLLVADEVDATRFELLARRGQAELADGRTTEAADTLAQALALWRGDQLGEATSAELRTQSDRLAGSRLVALEGRLEADLACGRHAEVLGELEALCRTHPFREGLWALWITAMYRTDRQADALAAYQDLRRVLAEELGVDPSPRLRALEAAVLAQDPTLSPPTDAGVGTTLVRELAGSLVGVVASPSTPLIGREREVEQVLERLRDPVVRIVTLTGPGGVGKTRIALQATTRAGDDFADGAWVVPLATCPRADLVPSAIAQRLGLRSSTGHDPQELLREFLATREVLLVLDNVEHVMEAAAHLSSLIATCPGLKLLVTSRSTLNLSAETQLPVPPLPVPPLPVPDRASPPDTAQLAGVAAVELFVQRARAADPTFAITPANASAVAEICARLNGLPLALELAAARARLLSPDAILSRLDRGLDLLSRGPRDLPERQRTMRSAVQWSYELLDETDQRAFRTLCVFVGGWTLEAAAAVCDATGGPPVDTLDTIASLIDQSMLHRIGDDGGEPRFGMLDTIRDYGIEALRSTGELQAASRAHAAYHVRLAEQAAGALTGPDQIDWLRRLETEHGNMRAALRAAIDMRDAPTAVRLASALGWFWYLRGYLSEGLGWFDEALECGVGWDDPARVRALCSASHLAYHPGHYARARTLGEEGLALARRLDDEQGVALALAALALVARATGRYEQSRQLYDEAIAIFRRRGDRRDLAEALARLGVLLGFQGEYDEADDVAAEAVQLMLEHGDREGAASATGTRAFALPGTGDDETARAMLERALAEMRAIGTWRHTTRALTNLGMIAARRGEHATARAQLEEAAAISLESGEPMYATVCLVGLAQVMIAQGRSAEAARLVGAARATRERLGGALPRLVEADEAAVTAAARKALGQQPFAVALADGAAMTLDRALASLPPADPVGDPAHPGGLTAREQEVLHLVAQGLSDADVADALVVSRRTVHAHLRSIYRKLDVRSRSAATRYALDHGLA